MMAFENRFEKPIITPQELKALYDSTAHFVILDVSNHKNAKNNYTHSHLKGALFVDLNTLLADINDDLSVGGRHPLPTLQQFANSLSMLGISRESHVIVYDDNFGANAAARLWWMLKAQGHQKVQVLDGGYKSALLAACPISSDCNMPAPTTYPVTDWKWPLVNMADVETMRTDNECFVVDLRDAARYRGETEPIDLIAGHIPGAINIPYLDNLDKEGFFKSPDELKAQYESVFRQTPAINIAVHCGSGVTACHTILAMAHAGMEIPNLYVGSWSEWSRHENEMATLNKDAS